MPRRSSPAKLEDWKRRMQRYEQSNQSIAQFCFNERVSVASFFVWRKKGQAAAARPAELAPLPPDRTGRQFGSVHQPRDQIGRASCRERV